MKTILWTVVAIIVLMLLAPKRPEDEDKRLLQLFVGLLIIGILAFLKYR